MNQKPRRLMHRAMPLILGGSLVKQIVIALVLGILLALVAPGAAGSVGILGGLFVSALKASFCSPGTQCSFYSIFTV